MDISNRYFVFYNKIYQICDLLVCLHNLSCLPQRIKIRHLNFCYSNIIQENTVNNLYLMIEKICILLKKQIIYTLYLTKKANYIYSSKSVTYFNYTLK